MNLMDFLFITLCICTGLRCKKQNYKINFKNQRLGHQEVGMHLSLCPLHTKHHLQHTKHHLIHHSGLTKSKHYGHALAHGDARATQAQSGACWE